MELFWLAICDGAIFGQTGHCRLIFAKKGPLGPQCFANVFGSSRLVSFWKIITLESTQARTRSDERHWRRRSSCCLGHFFETVSDQFVWDIHGCLVLGVSIWPFSSRQPSPQTLQVFVAGHASAKLLRYANVVSRAQTNRVLGIHMRLPPTCQSFDSARLSWLWFEWGSSRRLAQSCWILFAP